MFQFWRIKGINIPNILLPIIKTSCPEVLNYRHENNTVSKIYERIYHRMIGGASSSLHFTAVYADLIRHKLLEDEFKIAIYGGALMLIVDDFFDHRDQKEISNLIKFTSLILESAINGSFSTDNASIYFEEHYPGKLKPSDPLQETNVCLDKLAFNLYCEIIRLLENKKEQKNNLATCLQRVQHLQKLSLQQKAEREIATETLRRISADKGGYTALLGGYIIDPNLPAVDEDLYKYSRTPLDELERIIENSFNNRNFWRRQYLYELGAFTQYIDDKNDVDEDQELGIETIALRQPSSVEEKSLLQKRIISLFERAFKNDLSFFNYHLLLIVLQAGLKKLEQPHL